MCHFLCFTAIGRWISKYRLIWELKLVDVSSVVHQEASCKERHEGGDLPSLHYRNLHSTFQAMR